MKTNFFAKMVAFVITLIVADILFVEFTEQKDSSEKQGCYLYGLYISFQKKY